MYRNQISWVLALCTAAAVMSDGSRARAEFDSGSDGSDGALDCSWLAKDPGFDCAANCFAVDPENPGQIPCEFVVDLSAALSNPGTTWQTSGGDSDGDGFGDGVYDAKQWAVVYKFTTINIPANVIVKFKNHPSGAPVAWLAQGNVEIHGTVSLNGEAAHEVHQWPAFSEPGPGGFAGGAPADRTSLVGSLGFGPGSATGSDPNDLPDACHHGSNAYCGSPYCCDNSRPYGGAEAFPLMGGSGGGVLRGASANRPYVVAGAGGGAILIATSSEIFLGVGSRVTAFGGIGLCDSSYTHDPVRQQTGGGSGGTIRFVAGSRLSGTPYVSASGAGWPEACRDDSGNGWVRFEAAAMDDTFVAQPNYGVTTSFSAGALFPGNNAPNLEIVSISNNNDPVAAPADPLAGPESIEIPLDTDQASQVVIRAKNIPTTTAAGPTKITVRVVPVLGNEIIATSTALQAQPDGTLRATAIVTFPPGRSEIQLRANWTP